MINRRIAYYDEVGNTITRAKFRELYGTGCTVTTQTAGGTVVHKIKPKIKDPVNPSHYKQGGVECIDAIKASLSAEGFRGYLKGNVEKYLWRYEQKGGAEDLKKAQWYLERLISEQN